MKRMQRRDFESDPKKAKTALDTLDIEKVCKKWEEAVGMSWHNVRKIDTENLPIPMEKREETLIKLLKNCCQYLTHLTIDYQYPWMAGIIKNNCKNIVYFDVKLSSEYWSPICNVIRSMSKLKCLKAAVTSPEAFSIFNQFLRQLPVDIEEIHLVASDRDEKPQDTPVLDKFSNLRCLTLRRFCLTTATIKSILLKKNSLVYLDLNRCHFPETEYPKIFTELVNLEHLNLGEVKHLNVDTIIEIVNNCLNLKYFDCSTLNLFTSFSIPRNVFSKFKYLNNLEHLDIPAVDKSDDGDDNSLSYVVDNCEKLKYFNVGKGFNFSLSVVEEITKLKNLEYLNLYFVKVDSERMTNIANSCLELKELIMDFQYLPEIALEKLTNLKKLEKLNLAGCRNLTGNLLSKIAKNCTKLVDLNLAICPNITAVSLMQVGNLKNLKKLNINGVRRVPYAMFNNLHELEFLTCSDCRRVTDKAIIKVLDNCEKLSFLNVRGTRITTDTLIHADYRKFAVKVLNIYVDDEIRFSHLYRNRTHSRYVIINDNETIEDAYLFY